MLADVDTLHVKERVAQMVGHNGLINTCMCLLADLTGLQGWISTQVV